MWDVLGIEPTDDEKAVRRAYAAKLRACNPDRDPAGFKELREAYEAALEMRPYQARTPKAESDVQAAQSAAPADAQSENVAEPRPSPSPSSSQDERERAKLSRAIGEALKASDLEAALSVYDSGLASGAFGLGQRERALGRIMSAAIDDFSMSAENYLALLHRVGWDNLPGYNERSSIRYRASERAEAEAWYVHLKSIADGTERPDVSRSGNPLRLLGKALRRWMERRNARLLLGARQYLRLTRAGFESLRNLLMQYEHYQDWLERRLSAASVARAQAIVRREESWVSAVRELLLMLFTAGLVGGVVLLGVVFHVPVWWTFLLVVLYRMVRFVLVAARAD